MTPSTDVLWLHYGLVRATVHSYTISACNQPLSLLPSVDGTEVLAKKQRQYFGWEGNRRGKFE